MPTSLPKKTAVGAAVLCLVALVFVLLPSRDQGAGTDAGSENGTRAGSRPGPASRAPKVERDRAAAPGKRSFAEILALASNGGLAEQGLTAEQIKTFVDARNRSVDSLLAAFRLGGGEAYLKEAMERFPDHPQVLITSLSQVQDAEKRLAILENLKRVDPDNSMGNCMAARALFQLGRRDEALEELRKSVGKPLDDFTISSAQNAEEAFLFSGMPPAQAKLMALYGGTKSLVLQLRDLSDHMVKLGEEFRAGGDEASAESVRGIQSGLGQQLQGEGTLVDMLVGMVIEKKALRDIDSDEARARLEEIEQLKQNVTGRMKQVTELMKDPSVAEGDWMLYFDRAKLFGETAANDWMLEKYPQR